MKCGGYYLHIDGYFLSFLVWFLRRYHRRSVLSRFLVGGRGGDVVEDVDFNVDFEVDSESETRLIRESRVCKAPEHVTPLKWKEIWLAERRCSDGQ